MPIRIGVQVDAGNKLEKIAKDLKGIGTSLEKTGTSSKKAAAGVKAAGQALGGFAQQVKGAQGAAEKLYQAYQKISGIKTPPLFGPGSDPSKSARKALKEIQTLSTGLKTSRKEFYDFAEGATKAGGAVELVASKMYKAQTAAFAQAHATKLLTQSEAQYEAALGKTTALGEKGYRDSLKRAEGATREAAAKERMINMEQRLNTVRANAKLNVWEKKRNLELKITEKQLAATTAAEEKLKTVRATQAAGATKAGLASSWSAEDAAARKQVAGLSAAQVALLQKEGRLLQENTKNIKGNTKAYSNMGSAMRGLSGAFGTLWMSYGNMLPLMAAFAAATSLKQVVQFGAELEYTATYVNALGDATSDAYLSVEQLQTAMVSFEGLRAGPTELALGMKEFAKAGEEAGDSLKHVEEMSKFATIAELQLKDAITLVIGQSRAFDQSFSDSANMIAAAAMSSATTIEQMGTALSYTTELASVSGIAFDEVATAMAMLANAGIRGSKAGTAIRTSIIKMQAPAAAFKKRLDELGVSWSAFSEGGKITNLKSMFTELSRITQALPDEQRIALLKELFGLRAMRGGATILKNIGTSWDDLNQKIRESGEGTTFVSEKYKAMTDTLVGQTEILKVNFEELALSLDTSGFLKGIVTDVGNTIADLTKIIEEVKKIGPNIAKTRVGDKPLVSEKAMEGLNKVGDIAKRAFLPIESLKDGFRLLGTGVEKTNEALKLFRELQIEKTGIALIAEGKAEGFIGEADIAGLKAAEEALVGSTIAIKNNVTLLKEARLEQIDAINKLVDAKIKAIHNLKRADEALIEIYEAKLVKAGKPTADYEFRISLVGMSELEKKLATVKHKIESEAIKQGIEFADLDPNIQAWVKREQELIKNEIAQKKLNETTKIFESLQKDLDFVIKTEGMDAVEKKIYEIVERAEEYRKTLDWTNRQVNDFIAGQQQLAEALKNSKAETEAAKDALSKYKDAIKKISKFQEDAFDKFGDYEDQEVEIEFQIKAGDTSEADALLLRYKQMFEATRGGKVAGSDKQLAAIAKQYQEIDTERERMQKLQIARAREFEGLAALAAQKGTEGYKEQVHWLEKARAIYEGMDTSVDKVTKKQVANAKKQWEYQQKITGGGKRAWGTAKKSYDEAYAAYVRLYKAEKAGEADPKAKGTALQKQLEALKQNTAAQKTASQEHLKNLNTEKDKLKEIAGGYNENGEAIAKVVAESKVILNDFHTAWIQDIGTITEAYGKVSLTRPAEGGYETTVAEMGPDKTAAEQLNLGKLAVIEEKKLKAAKEQTQKVAKESNVEINNAVQAASEQVSTSAEAAANIVSENESITAAVAGAAELIIEIGSEWAEVESKILAVVTSVEAVEESIEGNRQTVLSATTDWISNNNKVIETYNGITAAADAAARAARSAAAASSSGGSNARAFGGPVTSGDTYLVGEKGPELFTPQKSGYIVPNNKLTANGDTVNINLSLNNEPPVAVQGTRQSARDIAAMFNRQKRLASA